MLGGYVMLNKADENLYVKAKNALTQGKPILFYEDANTCYYIDTITLDGTDIILTKGGKTITIEADGDITENGDIQPHLYNFYKSSVYLQTTDYGDIRGTWKFTAVDDNYNINSQDFNDIKNCLRKILNNCGIIDIINSDEDTQFTGSIYMVNGNIYIEGYSTSKSEFISIDIDQLSSDTGLELNIYWDKTKLF